MSVKGGVGKTTVAAGLGLVLAENRGDRVVALDANPDAGTLADRLTGVTSVTMRDLLNSAEEARSLTDVDRFTSLAGRLQVLASEQDPAAGEAFSRAEYERVCGVLARFANILVTDSGTGLVHSAMEARWPRPTGWSSSGRRPSTARPAAKTLDWLTAHGHGRHATNALVVLSCATGGAGRSTARPSARTSGPAAAASWRSPTTRTSRRAAASCCPPSGRRRSTRSCCSRPSWPTVSRRRPRRVSVGHPAPRPRAPARTRDAVPAPVRGRRQPAVQAPGPPVERPVEELLLPGPVQQALALVELGDLGVELLQRRADATQTIGEGHGSHAGAEARPRGIRRPRRREGPSPRHMEAYG